METVGDKVSNIYTFSLTSHRAWSLGLDEIPPSLKGGITVDDEERMTLTKDFLKQMFDFLMFALIRNEKLLTSLISRLVHSSQTKV